MIPALRWATVRAILMFDYKYCEEQNHKTVSTDHNLWRERRAKAESNRGLSAYQPNAIPLGQSDSLCSLGEENSFYKRDGSAYEPTKVSDYKRVIFFTSVFRLSELLCVSVWQPEWPPARVIYLQAGLWWWVVVVVFVVVVVGFFPNGTGTKSNNKKKGRKEWTVAYTQVDRLHRFPCTYWYEQVWSHSETFKICKTSPALWIHVWSNARRWLSKKQAPNQRKDLYRLLLSGTNSLFLSGLLPLLVLSNLYSFEYNVRGCGNLPQASW